ncbi:MAG: hypothetical protein COS47_00660 [Candidatus Nealsonbacteria bacterium CG03_land_8_20_14_0_80_36_12]|uniref:Helix-turn-helix domain-containing protein n=1 Tax=Candidatus Nealsonbacteria bacterium CG03_land_8_20_14_0_80_36_12 TaxID=1974701 RepID=A0A2M7BYP1_9BACT|nr:MAG: hypothetical protein COS47_00660 [Candidatus Nealsonbacteria bacterium CG03_land_8_20_14_0_80_36_12]
MINNKSNYVSLKEAAKYSGYSQEYLSLRARQKKLKAIKIARNWVTTKEWIDEYFRKVGKVKVGKVKRRRETTHKSHFIVIICLMVFILGCISVILTSPYFQSGPNSTSRATAKGEDERSSSTINIIAENIKELNIKENILLGTRVIGDWFLNQF